MKRAFKYLLLIVIILSCKSQYNYTSVGCVPDSKIIKRKFFTKTQLKKSTRNQSKDYLKKRFIKQKTMEKGKSIGILFILLGLLFLATISI